MRIEAGDDDGDDDGDIKRAFLTIANAAWWIQVQLCVEVEVEVKGKR